MLISFRPNQSTNPYLCIGNINSTEQKCLRVCVLFGKNHITASPLSSLLLVVTVAVKSIGIPLTDLEAALQYFLFCEVLQKGCCMSSEKIHYRLLPDAIFILMQHEMEHLISSCESVRVCQYGYMCCFTAAVLLAHGLKHVVFRQM